MGDWGRGLPPRGVAWIAAALLTLASGCFVHNPEYEPPADSAEMSTSTEGESSSGESDSLATATTSDETAGATGSTGSTSTSSPMTSASGTEPTTVDPTDPSDTTEPTETDAPEPVECELFAQDCEPGQKCVPFDSDDDGELDIALCVPAGADQLGDSCELNPEVFEDSCGEKLTCVAGTCMEICTGDMNSPICELGEADCLIFDPDLPLCVPNCDPTPGETICEIGSFTHCIPSEMNEFICVPGSGVEAGFGEGCEAINDCKAGYLCVDGPYVPECVDPYCCTKFCDLDADVCPGITDCIPFFEMQDPDYPSLGICVQL